MSKKKKEHVEEPKKKAKAPKKSEAPAAVETVTEALPEPAVSPKAVVEKPAKSPKPKIAIKKVSTPKKKSVTVTEPEIILNVEDISLRAYFIAERRRANGHHGDEATDWIAAERELRFEAIERLGVK
jgi:Protein of unknown function (DUF2934)